MTHEQQRRLLQELERIERIYGHVIKTSPQMAELFVEASHQAEEDLRRGEYEAAKHWVNIITTELSRKQREMVFGF